MISQMKNDNTQFGDQLVNQKQKNSATETQLQLSVIKLQEDCAVLAQKIELEQKKKKDLDEIVNSMKTGQRNVSSDKSKSVAELMKEQTGISQSDLPESIKNIKDHAERLRLIHLEHSKLENSNQDAELPTVQKGIKDHELKLQQIHIQHNEALAQIQEEKEFLNLARRERVIYSTVFKGIEKDAIVKAKELQNSIRQSEILKEEFRILSEQLQMIQEKANKEQNEFQKQYESLFKEDHNASQIPFITEPNDDKLPLKILQQLGSQPVQGEATQKDQSTVQVGDNSKEEKVPKKLASQPSQIINPMIDITQRVQEYESAFNKLYSETGLNSVENILAQYFNQEKQIDKIFVQINEINQEVDQTASEIDSIEAKLQKYKAMNKVPIKEDIQLDDTRAEKLQKGINRTLRNLEYTKSDFIEIQKVLGIDLIKQDDDERVFLSKVEQLDEIINDLLAVATLAEGKKIKQKPTSRLADYKRPESGETGFSPQKKIEVEKQEEEQQPDEDPELGSMLIEVAKKKIIAESRHTRDELQKEGRDLMLHNMQRKQQSKRSKAQQ